MKKIYCVTMRSFGVMSVELVCSEEIAVVNLAILHEKKGTLDKLYCRVYDDAGVQIEEGYLYKTAHTEQLDLST